MVEKPHTLYCIIGRTGSGKDTVAEGLKKTGMKAVCSYATRPKRDNETEGVEHYFISPEKMSVIRENERIAAYTKIGDVEYCATVAEVMQSDIYVIDPDGLKNLQIAMKDELINHKLDICTIYVYTPLIIRNKRIMESGRGKAAINSFLKRDNDENEQFSQFETVADYNYLLENTLTEDILIKNAKAIIEDNKKKNAEIIDTINKGVPLLNNIATLTEETTEEHDDHDL